MKTLLITGGAKRIGREIALTLHNEFNIALHYRSSKQAAEELASKLNATRADSCSLIQGDLHQEECLENLVQTAVKQFGSLDALINNASSFYPTPIETINNDHWHDLMGSNLKAPLFLAKHAAAELRKSKGCIINIIDIYAQKPLSNHPIYCAAKAGLSSATLSLANDLAPEIRVNGIAPGAILWPENDNSEITQTDLLKRVPLARLGEPQDIAKTAKFLICDAPYITGQIIAVDGGRTTRP